MKRTVFLLIVLALVFSPLLTLVSGAGKASAQAQVPPGQAALPGRLDGTGTHFALTGSRYLNVTVDSSQPITLTLESAPAMVRLYMAALPGTITATVTLGGLAPSAPYQLYQDDYHHGEAFTTDAGGRYAFSQDLVQPHLLFIQREAAVVFLGDSGWSDPAVGTWNRTKRVATLRKDLRQPIQIDSNGVTLDGAGHTVWGDGTGVGVFLAGKKDVSIKNLGVQGFGYEVYLQDAVGSVLTGNTVLGEGAYGIYLDGGMDNMLERNTASGVDCGLQVRGSNNRLVGNSISWNDYGIFLTAAGTNTLQGNVVEKNGSAGIHLGSVSSWNVVAGNTVSENGTGVSLSGPDNNRNTLSHNVVISNTTSGLDLRDGADDNWVFNNSFIANRVQAIVDNCTGNAFSRALPTGGNYWSDWTGSDGNRDGFVDGAYVFGSERDDLPRAAPLDALPPAPQIKLEGLAGRNGWYRSDVTVTLAAPAVPARSQASAPAYSLGDASWITYTLPFTISREGQSAVHYGALGSSRMITESRTAVVKIDKSGPLVEGSRSPAANEFDWNDGAVTVAFACRDAGQSGIASCPASVVLDSEGASQTVAGTATDNAGNSGTAVVSGINIDKSAPIITGTLVPTATASGWYSDDVKVHWTVTDTLSGLVPKTVLKDSLVTGEGRDLTAGPVEASDRAGNVGHGQVQGIKIDRTAPVISSTLDRPANAHGWYNGDVRVHWTVTDTLSGIDPVRQPGDSVIAGEGTDLTAEVAVTDRAGNQAQATSAPPVRIDRHGPDITGTLTTPANAHGWHNGDVRVHWAVTDTLSGVDRSTVPTDTLVSGEGADLAARAAASDLAGNASQATVSGIKIDRTAPVVTGTLDRRANAAGWYNGDVRVHWAVTDTLSGVDRSTVPTDTVLSQEGSSLAAGPVVVRDLAGNPSAPAALSGIKIDRTAPAITGTVHGLANAAGWYNQDVGVTFVCTDTLSGVASCATPITLTLEAAGQTAAGTATDRAGNTAQAMVAGINLDKTGPAITGTVLPSANAAGWHNGDVRVHWTVTDTLSGVDRSTVPTDTLLTVEGTDLAAHVTAADRAGNEGRGAVQGIQIDRTAPVISSTLDRPANAHGWYNGDVRVHWTVTDTLSGVDPAAVPADSVIGSEGTDLAASVVVTDRAGNPAQATSVPPVRIDRHGPDITGTLTTPANAHGWHNGDVKVHWAVTDTLSGVDRSTVPTDTLVSGEGADLAARAAASDLAGNASQAIVSGIRIDRTAPAITGTLDRPANAEGWYNGDVRVHWAVTDTLSGVDRSTVPTDTVVSQEGSGLAVGPVVVQDLAGNPSAPAALSGIKIDRTAPAITGTVHGLANAAGWYNRDVGVTFTCTDTLSGVASCATPITLTLEAAGQTATGTATDRAGNSAQAKLVGINLDKTGPAITGTVLPPANAAGWHNSDVRVHWTVTDTLSGIDPTKVPTDTILTKEGTDLSAAAEATDRAGNGTRGLVQGIQIDRTAPAISSTLDRPANAHGWYNGDVRVHWTVTDTLSGVDPAAAPADSVVGSEGTDLAASVVVTDRAGNQAQATSVPPVRIDRHGPTITGALTTPANAHGWYNGDVRVHWAVTDTLSGVDRSTVPTDTLVSGEGADLSARAAASDLAGNASQAIVSGIRIDRTAPAITGTLDRRANAAGWYNGDVRVHWTVTDTLSGVDRSTVPTDTVVSQEGSGLAVGPTIVQDLAGNKSKPTLLEGISIDLTPPSIRQGEVTGTKGLNGWYRSPVTVAYTATDSLSGLLSQSDARFTLKTTGEGEVAATGSREVYDLAGNRATAGPMTFKVDDTGPAVVGQATKPANAYGWYNGDVLVHWTVTDTISGVDPATAPADTRVTGQGSDHKVSATASDLAGNSTTTTLGGINIDTTLPTITGTMAGTPNRDGWYNRDVVIDFKCADALSGVATCASPVTLTKDGTGQSASGDVEDRAGNKATATIEGIDIDQTAPSVVAKADRTANANGWYSAPVTVTYACTDTLSGVAACPSPARFGEGGGQQASGTATDKAGNARTATVTGLNVDVTAPTIRAVPDHQRNAAGWYKGELTVNWVCGDTLSGIVLCQAPSVLGEGVDQAVSGVARDAAGNISLASLTGIKIDATPPALVGTPSSTSNQNGWYRGDVVVTWTCSDELSGIDGSCPGPSKVTGEGDGLSADATVNDKAGNLSSTSVSGLRIDRTPPRIAGAPDRDANANGWYNGDVSVKFVCADSLSGVASCSAPVLLQTDGANQAATGKAVDKADNEATTTVKGINIDKTAPTVVGVPDRSPNANGWYNGDVRVHWVANDAVSGVDVAAVPPDTILSGQGHQLSAGPITVVDRAGNRSAPASVTGIMIDRTPPALSGSPSTKPNASGWYDGDVTVRWYCEDDLSGFADPCPADTTMRDEGSGLTVSATIQDKAGNQTTARSQPEVNIDKSGPTITVTLPVSGALAAGTPLVFSAADSLSGVESLKATLRSGSSSTEISSGFKPSAGAYDLEVQAVDKGGNQSIATRHIVVSG